MLLFLRNLEFFKARIVFTVIYSVQTNKYSKINHASVITYYARADKI